MKRACIISIGNELLSGETVDTNTSYLARQLISHGIPTACVFTVPDEVEAIKCSLQRAVVDADMVLVTGGLGPTDDDVTRQGLAAFLGVELDFRQELFDQISGFFSQLNVNMAEANRVQAYIPKGARGIENKFGTAPGIMAEYEGVSIFCMPGVPKEMERMFTGSVLPVIESSVVDQAVVVRKVMCFGIGESTLADRLGDMMQRGRNPLINSTASTGVITLHVVGSAVEKAKASQMVDADITKLCEILGDVIYGYDGETLADVVGGELTKRGKTLALAESCTGGLVAKLFTDIPGSSNYFTHGWVTYSNQAKVGQLGVDSGVIESDGAVSEQVACQMARGARKKAKSDYAIGITGIAGPGGGTEQKPTGLVYIALDSPTCCKCERFVFPHGREYMRLRAALAAINMVRLEIG